MGVGEASHDATDKQGGIVENKHLDDSAPGPCEIKRIWHFTTENLQSVKSELGEIRWKKLNYVVSQTGELVIGENCGHFDLVGTRAVVAAGEVQLADREVCFVNNESGHYLNRGEEAFKAAQVAFKLYLGIDIEGRYFTSEYSEQEKRWMPLSEQSHASALKMTGKRNPCRIEPGLVRYRF